MATRARGKTKAESPGTGARDLRTELPRLLATARRPGEFHASGCVELPVVKITVDGVGALGLPIAPAQARALLERATPAPYGKGDRTLVDPAVRRCWQLPAESVHATDPRWSAVVERITRAALAGLGVTSKARAELYKLLVYDEGSFFLEHRDTEKSPGMFATLVVVLPSEHEGGELVVRHQGREATLDLSGGDLGLARFAAFYADCLHELRPVRSGYRVALVYNLVRTSGRAPSPPDHSATIEQVAAALSAWPDGAEAPVKLVVPLAHHYTPAELSFAALKNEDAAAAAVMTAACDRTGLLLRLAMVSIEESGMAEPVWDGGYGRRRWSRYEDEDDDDDDGDGGEYEVVEVSERDQRVDGWLCPDDQPEPRGAIGFEDSELAPPGALDDEAPDEDHFREATGNKGGSFERTYRRAALVVWPPRNELRLLQQGGPEVAIAALKRLSRSARTRADAHALATIVVDSWPRPGPSAFDPDRVSARDRVGDRAALLGALTTLRDPGLLRRFLREVVVAGAFHGEENGALARALGRLDPGEAGELMGALVRRAASLRLPSLAQLLRLVAEDRPAPCLAAPLDELIAAAGGGEVRARWDRDEEGAERRTAAIVDLTHAVAALRPSVARDDQLLRALRANPDRWPLDDVLLPAALALAPRGALRPVAEGLRAEVTAHLRARVALPLEPPADATRSTAGLHCRCQDCQGLRAFLNDRRELTWTLRAAEARRRHVQDAARGAKVDLALRTERKGSPYSLVCTKTQASYEARVVQREADLTALAKLGAPGRPPRRRR